MQPLLNFAVFSIFLSLPATVCSLFSPYFKLMHVAPLKLLAADYWPVIEAGVGLRLDASFAALICFAVFSIFLSLPATVCSLFSPYFKLMHVVPLKLLAADYCPVIEAGVGLRLDASFAALICFSATIFYASTIYALLLLVVTCSPPSPCLQMLHAATPMLLISGNDHIWHVSLARYS